MAHCITALIAQSPVVEKLLHGRSLVAVDLRDGWRLIPLEDSDLDDFGMDFSRIVNGFTYLSQAWIEFCTDLSKLGPLVYVETEYFGGMGFQGAVAFSCGSVIPPTPVSGNGAINLALRCVGITALGTSDEFDHIGLSKHRHTSDWRKAAIL